MRLHAHARLLLVYFLRFVERKYCIYILLQLSQHSLPLVPGMCIMLKLTIS